ncbi:MAG TPA: leucyl aminopeptidase [Ktedonobacteraceae bacterium]|nr:leucyl aminopeptidase [Ktedonobacteraceae bacterium]
MNIQSTTREIKSLAGDALVVGALRKRGSKEVALTSAAQAVNDSLEGLLQEITNAGEFKGGLGEIATIYTMGKLSTRRVVVVGLGSQEDLTGQSIRRASAIATRHLQNTAARQIVLALSEGNGNISLQDSIQAQAEGALLGSYNFRKYQTREQEAKLDSIEIVAPKGHDSAAKAAIARGIAMAEATNFARDLINEPPAVLTPTELANRATSMARKLGMEYEVIDKPQMEELGMGGLLGVARGSVQPPKFIILRYKGAPDGEKGIALVGKGITFDTGGISIKPAANMDEMKGDMGGAAAVIGAMQAIATLKPAINVTAYISSTENMPSGSAYVPGDILRIMNGKTIEIVNTDAEGRLVLADGLSYATREGHSPIIDVATLTGAIVVALGNNHSGLFSNNEQLTQEIIAAGKSVGERFWAMPMDNDFNDNIKSEIADVKQTSTRAGSSITAAKVLQNFVNEETPWAHLDIAGTSYVDSKKPHQEKGATGVAVRTLAEFAVNQAKK